jgi:hypothetical protein
MIILRTRCLLPLCCGTWAQGGTVLRHWFRWYSQCAFALYVPGTAEQYLAPDSYRAAQHPQRLQSAHAWAYRWSGAHCRVEYNSVEYNAQPHVTAQSVPLVAAWLFVDRA